MRIKKKLESIGVLGRIFNTKSSSDKDTYSCKYIDNELNAPKEDSIYDDQERVIGTWFGKKLYRKCYYYTVANPTAGANYEIPFPHPSSVVSLRGAYRTTNAQWHSLPDSNPNNMGYQAEIFLRESDVIVASFASNRTVTHISFIMEYTKD